MALPVPEIDPQGVPEKVRASLTGRGGEPESLTMATVGLCLLGAVFFLFRSRLTP